MFDAVVVGGGAAGMMAAITAAERGKHVLLLEKNAQLGRKIRITGKGRCNVTNNCEPRTVIESTPGNGRFLYGAVNHFTPQDTMDFFEGLGRAAENGARQPRVPGLGQCTRHCGRALEEAEKVPRGNSAGQCERGC